MKQPSLKRQQEILAHFAEALANHDLPDSRKYYDLCFDMEFDIPFFDELSQELTTAFEHWPPDPSGEGVTRDDVGPAAYADYLYCDTMSYAVTCILKRPEDVSLLDEAFVVAAAYFGTSRWKIDQVLQRFFREKADVG
jgi:hypothetical protein